ncbi:MAG: TetR/AcrR family transcriptional regulator [Frankiales bacterium]|nr:TetR/AcrR family transcriptional regulator [Frankiales bacterium]
MPVAPRTRDVMLREAARLFAERGFRGTSVGDIGAACGISGPAVYKHFPNKDAILSRLLVDISEQLVDGGRSVVQGTPDPEQALTALVDFHADFALAEPDVIRVQDRDLASLPDADRAVVRRLQRSYVEAWTDVLCRLEPDLGAEVARVRAHAVFGLLNSTPHSARGRAVARRQLTAMALRALRSPPDR